MIYVIMGPTCSGKTEVANFLIDKLDCEAINFDSFQIYQDMNIGTAKISQNDKHYQKYHLLDIRKPSESFSVMEYQQLCREELDKLKDKDVVLVGGTGLYFRAALYDYVFKKEENIDNSDLEKLSNEELWDLLNKLDVDESKKIHQNNRKRLIRAIALIRSNEMNKTEMLNEQKHELIYPIVRFIFICPEREKLYENINQRVEKMFESGLVDEVKGLLAKYKLSLTASQGDRKSVV